MTKKPQFSNTAYHYHYLTEDGTLIRLKTKRRPKATTIPKSGTWVIREWRGGKWVMPCFPEITFGRLQQLTFIGRSPA